MRESCERGREREGGGICMAVRPDTERRAEGGTGDSSSFRLGEITLAHTYIFLLAKIVIFAFIRSLERYKVRDKETNTQSADLMP